MVKLTKQLDVMNEILNKFPKNLILNITKSEILLSGQRLDEAEE